MLAAEDEVPPLSYPEHRAEGWEGTLSDGEQTESNDDFSKLCRLCISMQDPAGMLPIFSEESESLEDKIESVIRIEVRYDDGLPLNVCISCLESLDAAYRFIERAVAGDNTLRQRIMRVKVEEPAQECGDDSIADEGSVAGDGHQVDPLSVEFDPDDHQENEDWSESCVKDEADPLTIADIYSLPSTSWAHAASKKPRANRKPRKSVPADGAKRKRGRPRKNAAVATEPKRPAPERKYDLIDYDDATEGETENEDRSDDDWVPDLEDLSRPKPPAEVLAEGTNGDAVPAAEDGQKDAAAIKPLPKSTAKRGRPRKVQPFDALGSKDGDPKKEKDGEPTHDCPTCGKSFAKRTNLVNHYRTHTGERPYGCQHCGNAFADRSTLRQHIMTHDRIKPFQCELCPGKFTRKQSWRNHMLVHKGIKEYRCDVCDRTFTLKEGLREHTRSHGNGERHGCTICGKSFVKKWRLKEHARIHGPTDTQAFHCSFCIRVFSTADDLAEHVEIIHSNPRRFPCPICPKAFTDRSSLTVHQRRHTGERPFVCTDCGKAFAKSSVYHIHRRSHTGEKPYSCDFCTEMFASSAARNVHARRHGPSAPLAVGLM